MPSDYVLQQYQHAAVSIIYAMQGNPHQPVDMGDGRILMLWQLEASKLHHLKLQIEALRQMGLA